MIVLYIGGVTQLYYKIRQKSFVSPKYTTERGERVGWGERKREGVGRERERASIHNDIGLSSVTRGHGVGMNI